MKILCKIIILIVFIIIVILFMNIFNYFKIQKNNEKYVEYCNLNNEKYSDFINSTNDTGEEYLGVINDSKSCYCKMYSRLLPRLLVYKVKYDNKDLEFIKPSHNEYVIPTIALEKSDAFISYGIGDDADFEYVISQLYKKNLYAFDCGIENINKKNEYIFFESECIGLDKYVLTEKGQISSEKTHTFKEKLEELNLQDKKLFLKMDIAGAEFDVLPDVIKYNKNIVGMSFVIRFYDSNKLIETEKLLKEIDKNFILVARNELPGKKYCSCYFKKDHISPRISLTYINKEYINKKYIPFKQSYNEKTDYKQLYYPGYCLYKFEMDWRLILSEKIKSLFGEV